MTVGRYTSPDLGNVRERIAIDGHPIDEETFAATLEYLQPFIELVEQRLGEQLTYFELLTVMAFEAFFDRPVHAAVIEVGLGGEYDATNVADGQVSVMTNVSQDHVRQFFGDLTKAAWEKSGIAKEGATFITAVDQPDLLEIVESRASERGVSSFIRFGADIDVLDRQVAFGGQVITVRGLRTTYTDVFLRLFGEQQARNAALAIAAVEAFVGEALDEEVVAGALTKVVTPARVEVVHRDPLVVVDGGHNPASAEAVKDTVTEAFAYERLILVIGMLEEKLIEDVLGIWAPIVDRFVVTAPTTTQRAAVPQRLAQALFELGVTDERVIVIDGVPEATRYAMDEAGSNDLVLVFGSFFTASEVRAWLRDTGALAEA